MVEFTVSRIVWPATHRLILSQYPPIDLFDDVADPRDWEALAVAQSRTNPRILEQIGDLSLVPAERRLSGEGASWVMAAFTHISPDRVSRFSAGAYGVYYAGDSLETALHEHSFHMARVYRDAGLQPSWISEVRQLVGTIASDLIDLTDRCRADLLDPDDYTSSQAFAAEARSTGANGIVYPSVRYRPGRCIAAFYPDVVTLPVQADHFRYYWDGAAIRYARKISGDRVVYEISEGAGSG